MNANQNEFVTSQVFDAPLDTVWQAWTETEELKKWWGPEGVVIVHCTNDLRPGGVMHYGMEIPGVTTMWGKWIYREIVVPSKIVSIVSFSDENQGMSRHPFAPDWPMETHSTIIFEELGDKTKLTVKWSPFNATDAEIKMFDTSHENMKQGWAGTFNQLANYLKTKVS